MSKMQTLRWLSYISTRRLPRIPSKPQILISFQVFSSSSTSVSNPLFNYLIDDLNLPRNRAFCISSRYSSVESLEKPKSMVRFLRDLGLTETEIASSVNGCPQLLFSNIEKTLKPKIKLFQDLGLVGPHLGTFLAKNYSLFSSSVERCLIPNIELVRKLLGDGVNDEVLRRVIHKCNRIVMSSHLKLSNNIKFLQSNGVVGPRLAMLLKREPRVFAFSESKLRDLVSDVMEMGFSIDSGMFVYGIMCASSLKRATFRRKMEIFAKIGISERDCLDMFKRAPFLFKASDDRINKGIDFFLNTVKYDAKVLVSSPMLLQHSLEGKVIPRYGLLQVLKAKKLLKKEPRLTYVLSLTEEVFLKKFLFKKDDLGEIAVIYMSHCEKEWKKCL